MASPWIVVRAGPPAASLVHQVKAGGEDALLAVVVEVWGAGDRAGAIESQLAAGIAAAFERQPGGTTARLKAALVGADHWLQRLKAERSAAWGLGDDCGAGASVLVATAGEAILAQVGPAVAFGGAVTGTSSTQPSRFPSQSPWLRRDVVALSDHPLAPPLGIARPVPGAHATPGSRGSSRPSAAERPLDILWANWPLGAGIGALLTRSTMAARVPRDVAERLFTASAGELKAVLASVFDADTPLIVVARRGARRPATPTPDRATPRPDHTTATPARTAPPSPASEGSDSAPSAPASDLPTAKGPTASRPVPIRDSDTDAVDTTTTPTARDVMAVVSRLLRLGLLEGARLGARVLVALFPNRDAQGADSYTVERARLAAALAVGLPVAMVGLALMMRARFAEVGPDTAAPPVAIPGAGPDLGAAAAAARDHAAGVVRLGDIEPLANLPGLPEDPRRVVVAAAGVAYVLNTTLDQVDRVAGGVAAPVLAKSQAAGGAVVGALADLFWIPPVGNGPEGRVLALDEAGALWAVSGGSVAAVPRAERPGWIGVGRAAGFDGRLYALDRSTGQIYRYAPSADGAASFAADGEDWLNPAQDLADAIDLALDGALYVLRQDGRIAKYAGGNAVLFEMTGVQPALADPRTIYASATAGKVLVTDPANGRIVVLSPEGAFQAQLMRPPQPLADPPDDGRFGLLHDAWWDEPGRRLYVVAGGTLYGAGYGE